MTEKEIFLDRWDREFQTTLKILKAYPKDQADLKASERSGSAKVLAWTLVLGQNVVQHAIEGELKMEALPKSPATLDEIIAIYQRTHETLVGKLRALPEAEFGKTMKFFVGPKQMGDVRKGDIFWNFLMDNVHHRGQLSVYMRIAGAKVPSIYGPSGDEPWT